MLIDSLTFALVKSGCLEGFWGKLDAGEDASLGIAASARPFMVASRFARKPQTTFVVVAGEDAAISFARNLAAYVGEERVLRFPERTDLPFAPRPANLSVVAQRMEAAYALLSSSPVIVVASAASLVRMMPPASAGVALPLRLKVGNELADMGMAGVEELGDLTHALEERGYANTGELDGPGTFAVRGGTVDVFPGNLSYPVRLDFFGDELDEIRRIVSSTGQTIASLDAVEIYSVTEYSCSKAMLARARKKIEKPALTNPALRSLLENLEGGLRFDGADALLPYLYNKTVTLGDYVGDGALTVLVEPRSLFDDASRSYEELAAKAKGSNIALSGLFAEPASLDFGGGQRATYVSIMRVGGAVDDELQVKRVEVAGAPERLFGKLRSLVDGSYTVVFSAPNYRARQDMKLAFVDHGLPIQERLDTGGEDDFVVGGEGLGSLDAHEAADDAPNAALARRRLRRGVVNVVDVDIPLGMIIPAAKLALISIADTQGAQQAARER
ncbi:MAG: transcription-repair coupling factor, partial [Eggerthellaceae bacterium]|nr:transcription-repair coupling factor [Eggerthellaceae bacterium]